MSYDHDERSDDEDTTPDQGLLALLGRIPRAIAATAGVITSLGIIAGATIGVITWLSNDGSSTTGPTTATAPVHGGSDDRTGSSITFPPFTLPAGQGTAKISLSRSSGPPGSEIMVSGHGFDPGEDVTISVGAIEVTTVQADASGSFSNAAVTIPEFYRVFSPGTPADVHADGKSSIRFDQEPFTITD